MLRALTFIVSLWASLAFAAGPSTTAVNSPAQSTDNLTARAVDLHTATGDVATIAIPSWVTAYQILAVSVGNCSTTPVLAQVAVFTGAGGTGTTVVAAGTVTGATSASVILTQTLAGTVAATRLTSASLFVRLTVANVAALTCDINVRIQDWS